MAANGLAARLANGRGPFAGVAGSLGGLYVAPRRRRDTGAGLLDVAAAARACGARNVRADVAAFDE